MVTSPTVSLLYVIVCGALLGRADPGTCPLPVRVLLSQLGWFMFRPSRSALLVATVSLAGGVLTTPGAAYAADTTTHLSATQMVAALKPVAVASTAAAEGGWKAVVTMAGDPMPLSLTYVVDPPRGIAYHRLRAVGLDEATYAVAGKGLYRALPDAASRAAVKMMGRPTVRYVFNPDRSLTLAQHLRDGGAPTPASALSDDAGYPGTKTVHDDGSTDYVQVVDDLTVTLRVNPAGTLSGGHASGAGFTAKLTYAYGPQTIAVPAATTVISEAQLSLGMWYLDMPAHVKDVSYQGAAQTRRAARGATVKVASLRKIVRRAVSTFNTKAQLKMIKVKDVRRGVRVYATNPWTHKTVSYMVIASGKKVIVRS